MYEMLQPWLWRPCAAHNPSDLNLIYFVENATALGGILVAWFATFQPAFPHKVGGANGSVQIVCSRLLWLLNTT